jgi:hypothetical protein
MDKIASLKARLHQAIPTQRLSEVVDEALQLQEEAQALQDMLPDSWRFHIGPPHTNPPWAYQGIAHQYPGHPMARHWNMLRITKLFLNEVVWYTATFVARSKEEGVPEILRYCNDLDTAALQAAAMANRTQIVTDILASVTHYVDENGTNFSPAARFLIWPLTAVAERPLTPKPARNYAIWCLYEIATQARIPQALQAARAIESGSSTDW